MCFNIQFYPFIVKNSLEGFQHFLRTPTYSTFYLLPDNDRKLHMLLFRVELVSPQYCKYLLTEITTFSCGLSSPLTSFFIIYRSIVCELSQFFIELFSINLSITSFINGLVESPSRCLVNFFDSRHRNIPLALHLYE